MTPSKLPRRSVGLIGGVALAAVAFGAYAAVNHQEAEAPPTAAVAGRGQLVTVSRAELRPFARRVPLSGQARPRKDVRVFAPAQGVRVLALLVEQGDYVKRGQPLARLDTSLIEAQGASAIAAVKEAEAAEIRAVNAYDRAESIKDSGALSAEQIDQRRADADAAKARLAQARASYAEWNARTQGGYVRAPASGLVIERPAVLGQPVEGQTLFRIVEDNALEVAAEVAESDMLALKVGQQATFHMVDGTPVNAVLRRPPPAIDAKTRTGTALFDLPADPKLRSGMFLRGEAELPPEQTLAVPQAALTYDGQQAYVFVVDASNHVRRTPIALADRVDELVAVRSGLSPGARIVVGGAAFLQDGDLVRPVESEAETAATAEAKSDAGG
jgi:RND family efflux transporter MFP subunit